MAKLTIKTKNEIDEDEILQEVAPTTEELKDAELEVKILNILRYIKDTDGGGIVE